MSEQKRLDKQTEGEIKRGLKEISEGKVVPLSEIEKRPDRPDKEKIAKILVNWGSYMSNNTLPPCGKWADQILALIEEAKKRGFDEGVRKTTDAADSTFGSLLKVAKREEKERIKKSINDYYARPDVDQGILGFTEAVRQALNEEK